MKLAVVADPETATGFRFGGFEAIFAQTAEEAKERLATLIASGQYALIAVSTALLPDPHSALEREMRGKDLPVLLPLPGLAQGEGESAEAYMRRLVKETLGYEIRI
jgi:V/A-type H+-transporting ATPase subunit F